MAPKTLSPWLAGFLHSELEAVVAWKRDINSGIKVDPESRFSDDGSNFRSLVDPMPEHVEVQLIKVLSTDEDLSVLVSDGAIQIKAKVSEAVAAAFEDETGAPLSLDVTGDIFHPKRLTVVSTPFGPADGFVQLEIDEIDYKHHLRKLLGNPQPVEHDDSVRQSIEAIMHLRLLPIAPEDEPNALQSDDDAASDLNSVSTSQPADSQPPVQSQYAAQRKPPGPSLAKDGFELATGVNLDRPVQPLSGSYRVAPAIPKLPQELEQKRLNLLRLLGEKATPTDQIQNVATVTPDIAAPEAAIETCDTTFLSVHSAASSAQPSAQKPPERITSESAKPEKSLFIYGRRKIPVKPPENSVHNAASSAQPPPEPSTSESTPTINKSLFVYGRRKIPANQMRLLENSWSWLPPLPGKQFPKPNVPLELLTKWNEEAGNPSPSAPVSQQVLVVQSSKAPSEESESSSDEEEPIAESEWPPSQLPREQIQTDPTPKSTVDDEGAIEWSSSPPQRRRDEPPPSSSLGSIIRGTQDDLEMAAPRPLPGPSRRPNFRPDATMRYDESSQVERRFGRTESKVVNAARCGSARSLPPQSPSTRVLPDTPRKEPTVPRANFPHPSTPRAHDRTPLPRSPRRSETTSLAQQERWNTAKRSRDSSLPPRQTHSPMQSTPRVGQSGAAQRSSALPDKVPTGPRSERQLHSNNPGPSQHSYRQSSDCWRPPPETSNFRIHSSLEQTDRDPAYENMLARKRFFESDRRQSWLKDNYRPDRNGNISLGMVLARYRHVCPWDRVASREDLLRASQDVFTDVRITPGYMYSARASDAGSSGLPSAQQTTRGGVNTAKNRSMIRHDNPDIERAAELCRNFLELRPGNGNAFGQPLPRRKQKAHVDVLKWNS